MEMNSKDLLAIHEDDMWKCSRCSLCKFPPLEQVKSSKFYSSCCSIDYGYFHAWSGGGKVEMAFSLQKERIKEISEEMKKAIFQCTLCGACDVSCKGNIGLEVLETIFDLRRYYIRTHDPLPAHQKYLNNAEKYNNVYGEPHKKRQDWIKETSTHSEPNSGTLFFTGCTGSYRQQDMVQASVEILDRAEYSFQVSDDEVCCGSPIYRAGAVEEAIPYFERTLQLFKQNSITEVITACPGCYAMFVAEYPKFLSKEYREIWKKIKFRHMTEVIDDLLRKKKLKLQDDDEKEILVTYHDPCHLGRGGESYVGEWKGKKKKIFNQLVIYEPPKKIRYGIKGVYDAPRSILKKLKNVKFIEMFRIQEYAYCCGAGGGVKAAYPDMAEKTSLNRIEEAEYVLNSSKKSNTKKKILVSACPFCKTNLEDALEKKGSDVKYMDINQLVLKRLKK